MPSFGIIHCSARVHAILRGPLRLDGHGQGGPSEVSGEHVTTWSERVLFGQDSLELSVSDDAPQESDRPNGPRSSDGPAALWLPLTEGVVRLSGMRIALGRAAPSAASQDAPPEHGQRTESLPGPTADHTAVPIATHQGPAQVTEPVPEQTPVPEQAPVPEPGSADAVASAAQQKPASGQPRAAEQEPADETASEVTGVYEPFVPDGPASDVPPVPAEPTVPDGPASDVPPVPAEPTVPDGPAPDVPPVPDLSPVPETPPAAVPGLIDSVPWLRANSVPARPPLPPHPAVPPHPPTAAPATAPTPAAFATPDGDHGGNHDGDHDGNTLMRSSLTENLAVAGTPGQRGTPETVPAGTGPLVLGRACAQGHANPPVASACLTCGAALTQEPRQLRRPALGQIRFSSGEVVTLDRPVVIGRQPSVSRVQGGVMPRLVQVASPGGDISRSHVEVRLEGWHVHALRSEGHQRHRPDP